jgi:hypothetical protein
MTPNSLVNVYRRVTPPHLLHPETLPCSSLCLLYTEDGSVMAHRNTACVCTPQSQQLSQSSCSITAIPVHKFVLTVVLLCCSADNYTQTTTAVRRPNIIGGTEADSGAVKVKIRQDGMGDMELHITNLLQGRAVMGTCGTGRATLAVAVSTSLPFVSFFQFLSSVTFLSSLKGPIHCKGPHTLYRAPYTVESPIHCKGPLTL